MELDLSALSVVFGVSLLSASLRLSQGKRVIATWVAANEVRSRRAAEVRFFSKRITRISGTRYPDSFACSLGHGGLRSFCRTGAFLILLGTSS